MKSHEAIEAVKNGHRIARSGWNGKGMYVYRYDVEGFKPALVIRTASGAHQLGWVFSQDDLFSDDWEIVTPRPRGSRLTPFNRPHGESDDRSR